MNKWETLVDQKVKEIIGDGDISHLPGAGKPLNLDADEYTPADQRIVYKIMKDHDIAPDWMVTGQALDQIKDKLVKQIEIRASRYQSELKKALLRSTILEQIDIEEKWKVYVEDFMERVSKYNKEVLLYNLKVPNHVTHKQILMGDKLITTALTKGKGD